VNKPLSAIRVLDFTRLLPGPLATQHLADLGAEVVKVEDTAAGDYARQFGLEPGDDARISPFFSAINRGKHIERLDLRENSSRARCLVLAEQADVVIESFRPGVMQRLGLSYATLAARNPRLVYCSITGYGQHGPRAHEAGHDLNYLAVAGALPALADGSGAPIMPNLQVADVLGGAMMAVTGILAALLDARRTGRGRHVDVAMADGVMLHNLTQLYSHNLSGQSKPAGQDLLNGGVPCYNLYRCADGRWLAMGALELKFWQVVCGVLDQPGWAMQHWSLGQTPGSDAALALTAQVRQLIASQTSKHWQQRFAGSDACVSIALTFEEALAQPQFAARGFIKHGGIGGFDMQWFDLHASLFGREPE
jgi:crotonobetainyl-CoA:carnitine CoA-transferase CaiB-like acyl-CoA transferase